MSKVHNRPGNMAKVMPKAFLLATLVLATTATAQCKLSLFDNLIIINNNNNNNFVHRQIDLLLVRRRQHLAVRRDVDGGEPVLVESKLPRVHSRQSAVRLVHGDEQLHLQPM